MGDVMDRPRIDPRIARRWIEARREEGRRRLRFVTGAGVAAAVVALAAGLLLTPLFSVRHLRVTVDGPIPAGSVAGLSGLAHHPLLIHVDPGGVAARLDSDPWLGAARVARHWPDTVTVSVAVRSPLAVVALANRGSGPAWAEVDATGRVLAEVTGRAPGTPQLQGVGPAPAPGRWMAGSLGPRVAPGAAAGAVDMAAVSDGPDVPRGVTAALATLAALPPVLRSDVRTVTVGPGGALSLVIAPPRLAVGTVRVNLGDGSQLAAKLSSLQTVLTQAGLGGVTAIDVSVPDRPAALTARQ